MIRSGDRIPTGTGPNRRRLTVAEAEAGGLPDRMTRDEWRAMHDASLQAQQAAHKRHAGRYHQTLRHDDEADREADGVAGRFYSQHGV